MRRPTIIVVLMFVLALGAGVVAGKLSARVSQPAAERTATSLTTQLDLSSDQRAQMQHIWEHVREVAHRCARDKETLKKEHEDAVVSLLTDAQKVKYAELTKNANTDKEKIDTLEKQTFEDAVKKTREMLNDQQRLAYDQILKDRVGDSVGSLSGIDSAGHGPNAGPSSQQGR
ncbi:MAG: hypothetical protein JWL69_2615 [Phycisphaerales bacterium]|jgi:hypothetical protein|nr:hypothetical protein [Phycisphaerales bacterium]MDB5355279.1 hypothetical protein [Phycisphaerales bacterium]